MEWEMLEQDPEGFEQVIIRGEFDLYAAPRFAAEVLPRIERGNTKICFDMSAVSYLDSSGVGALIKILQTGRRCSGNILFRGIRGSPRKVLRMSNILPLLQEDMQQEPL